MNVLLYGGGVDSTALLVYLAKQGEKFIICHANYGQKAFAGEHKSAKYFCKKYNLELVSPKLDLSFASNSSLMKNVPGDTTTNTKVELRNVIFACLAGSYIASKCTDTYNKIYLGYHAESAFVAQNYPDGIVKNIRSLATTLSKCTGRTFKLEFPFQRKTRENIYKLGYKLDRDVIYKSHTCYDFKECGICSHCTLKKQLIEKYNLR